MDIKLVCIILMLTVVLLEAKIYLWRELAFSRKAIIDYLFPKDSDIVRVRNPDEVRTEANNVTTLDFVSATRLSFIIYLHLKHA